MSKQTYTTSEAAAALDVSVGRVRQMILDGTIQAQRFGRALVITSAELEKARRRKTKPGPARKPGPLPGAKKAGGRSRKAGN